MSYEIARIVLVNALVLSTQKKNNLFGRCHIALFVKTRIQVLEGTARVK